MTERLERHGIQKTVNRTHIKKSVLKHFPDLTEKKAVTKFSSFVQRLLGWSYQLHLKHQKRKYIHYVWQRLLSEKTFWIMTLHSGLMVNFPKTAKNHLFHYVWSISSIISLKAPNHHPNKRILGRYPVSQMAMLNMSSLSSNLNCEPPLAVFLALEMHSQTRSKVGRTFTQIWSEHVRLMHTGDMDVIVILLSNLHHIKAMNLPVEIKIFFKAGKSTRMISLNTIATNLGMTTCKAMAFFHAFTGSDTTSSFKFKGKRSLCKLMHKVPFLMVEFTTIVNTPFQTSPRMKEVAAIFIYLYIGIYLYSCIV